MKLFGLFEIKRIRKIKQITKSPIQYYVDEQGVISKKDIGGNLIVTHSVSDDFDGKIIDFKKLPSWRRDQLRRSSMSIDDVQLKEILK